MQVLPLNPHEEDVRDGAQINVEPSRSGGLWKVIIPAIRCPVCGSVQTRAMTGKRGSGEGLSEHYRCCVDCDSRFRVIHE